MQPVPYWTPDRWNNIGPVDVYHLEAPGVCSNTITYMLDGKVGLLADLALLAQTAALAREVGWFLPRAIILYRTTVAQSNVLRRRHILEPRKVSPPVCHGESPSNDKNRWLDHFHDVNDLLSGPEPGCKRPPPDGTSALAMPGVRTEVSSRTRCLSTSC
jgi:hypothetical protein